MKKFLLSIVGLLILGQGAQATSLIRPLPALNVRLEMKVAPIRENHHLPFGANTKTIRVFGNGRVFFYKGFGLPKQVEVISSYKMYEINQLIEAARFGAIADNTGKVVCLAVPNQTRSLMADNGRVFLSSSSFPCGYSRYNTSDAARALSSLMNELMAHANDSFSRE